MVDVSHEPRWGRISEAAGEDPYLNSVMAAARVQGAQGDDYSAPDKVVTSVKHYAAYGEPEAGRDYATTDMSLSRLWNVYLPPFKAAVDAGSDTRDVLVQRDQRRAGLREHVHRERRPQGALGLRRLHRERLHRRRRAARLPGREPGRRAVRARRRRGRRARRPSRRSTPAPTPRWSRRTTATSARQLVASGEVSMSRIDDAVRRILRIKFRAGPVRQPATTTSTTAEDADPAGRTAPPPARPRGARWCC